MVFGPSFKQDIIFPTFLPETCRVSKAIRDESAPIFLKSRAFMIPSKCHAFFVFLSSFPEDEGFTSIRHLKFTSFRMMRIGLDQEETYSKAARAIVELMTRCPRLVTVSFFLHFFEFVMERDHRRRYWG